MADPKDAVAQIQEAWGEAQAQLAVLREQVEHAASLAQAKVQSNVLVKDLDRAYHALGEAVWAEVSKGRLKLPPNVSTVRKALELVTEKLQAQNASVDALLAEGAEIAQRAQEKKSGASKPLANAAKKR
ncbi:MAG: hypothetical protein JNG84_04780 [Archangium sp.]|nr:hypothetical protein [Archangium sp.]